jgi:hypothetical protein
MYQSEESPQTCRAIPMPETHYPPDGAGFRQRIAALHGVGGAGQLRAVVGGIDEVVAAAAEVAVGHSAGGVVSERSGLLVVVPVLLLILILDVVDLVGIAVAVVGQITDLNPAYEIMIIERVGRGRALLLALQDLTVAGVGEADRARAPVGDADVRRAALAVIGVGRGEQRVAARVAVAVEAVGRDLRLVPPGVADRGAGVGRGAVAAELVHCHRNPTVIHRVRLGFHRSPTPRWFGRAYRATRP